MTTVLPGRRSDTAPTTTVGARGWGAYLPAQRVDNDEVAAPAGVDA
ncbi:MAG: 3-oxoacyl-ACP synthase, partial [Pseudonocardia sp.]|nr:3-oxoacyl-ACP synthase [Pseudonocardia sp.]